MKICPKCSLSKNFSEFYLRKTGVRAGQYYEKCKDCMKLRGRNYYHQNRDRQLPLTLIRRRRAYYEKRQFIIETKNVPCADCNVRYPYYVMDFDHRSHKEKVTEVAYMMTHNWALDKIKQEVKKCDILCANCHRIRTFKKFNN